MEVAPVRIFCLLIYLGIPVLFPMEMQNISSCVQGHAGQDLLYTTNSGGNLPMENGEWNLELRTPEDSSNYYYWFSGETFGNGEWRRICSTRAQDAGSLVSTCQLGEGQWAMETMERATDPGKIYSKLSPRVVAIIKLLPPCKLWVKCHDF